jgi:Cap4 dsDNA endonuclease
MKGAWMLSEWTPDKVADEEIAGSDTTRRYLYQAAYSALQSVLMIDEKSVYDELFCEQVEDILIRLVDGTFIAIQVKSQDEINGGFKFGDEPILKGISRLIVHEKDFPNKFKKYRFCTNCGFAETENSSDLFYCIESLRQNNGDLEKAYQKIDFSKYIQKLSSLSEVNDPQIVVNTLLKIESVRWAALRDYKKVLTAEIASFLKAEHQPQNLLIKTSEMLIQKALDAAEYPGEQTQPACTEWINDPKQAIITDIIEKK